MLLLQPLLSSFYHGFSSSSSSSSSSSLNKLCHCYPHALNFPLSPKSQRNRRSGISSQHSPPPVTRMDATSEPGGLSPFPEHTELRKDPPFHHPAKNGLVLVSDLDFTLVDHSDPSHSALLDFNCLWAAEYAYNSHLVYCTGRTMERYMEVVKDAPLLTPDVLILSVGTEIRWGSSLEIDKEWEKELEDGWNRDIVVEIARTIPGLRFQEDPDQGSYKVSFKVSKEDMPGIQKELETKLTDKGLKVRLIYSSGIDLDVLPYKAGKGQAAAFVLRKLHLECGVERRILVCGDSGNDIDLFHVDSSFGVIVSNAQPDLLEWHESHESPDVLHASQRCSGAIIEGLKHFGLGPHMSPFERINEEFVPTVPTDQGKFPSPGSAYKEVVEFNVFMVKWLRGQVPNTEESFQRLQGVIGGHARMIYPWGVESRLVESIDGLRPKHGTMKGLDYSIWFDALKHEELADGVYLVTWQPWERTAGSEKKGYFASAIFAAKEGTPNGLEWRHFHETFRKS